jgi:hypothetical protein
MGIGAMSRRRWVGLVALGGAVLMLVAGVTVLKTRLDAVEFLIYWLSCAGLTGVAIVTALVDMRATRYQLRQEKRELLEATIDGIAREARSKTRRNGKPQRRG